MLKPIPSREAPSGKVSSEFIEDELIDAEERFKGRILTESVYFLRGIKGAEKRCLIRSRAADMLEEALQKLPQGLTFKIFDCWRSVETQQALYEAYLAVLKKQAPDMDAASLEAAAKQFVSKPSLDPEAPSVHNTGGAIDLTLFDTVSGRELDMGTAFDDFTDRAHTDYFEKNCFCEKEREIRDNRRLLYACMTETGFTNLPSEWWHFDYGDSFWSYYTGNPALFRGTGE